MAGHEVLLRPMSSGERVAEAMRRSITYLPADMKGLAGALVAPQNIALFSGTLVVWAASHAFGIGEVVDVVLLGVGALSLGFAVFEGADELHEFVKGSLAARSDAQLDAASRHFARAICLLGVSTLQAVLLRGQATATVARGRPQVYPRPNVGEAPLSAAKLTVQRPARLPQGDLGTTSAYGAIRIARNQPLSEQRITLFHELVHRYFSPRMGPFRQLRAELRMSIYERSALLRYLEEALAEGYGQLRVNGLTSALKAIKFPVRAGYMTVSALRAEGMAIGTIILGNTVFHVSMNLGPIPDHD